MHIDAHQKPPASLREVFKNNQKLKPNSITPDRGIIDFRLGLRPEQQADFICAAWHDNSTLQKIFARYTESAETVPSQAVDGGDLLSGNRSLHVIYESRAIPGLLVVPSAIPLHVQRCILDRTFHRDLSNPLHLTNIDLHYDFKRPLGGASFFDLDPSPVKLTYPKDTQVHKPLSVSQIMNKKLRWMTLGGQYDWTRKVYPDSMPPEFPQDLRALLLDLFPTTVAEAAIINLYSPGDTLSLHRDVSEDCDNGLISLSIGCDCLFLIGLQDPGSEGRTRHLVLRLCSGDIVYMTGPSRLAWHAVPVIIPSTCPELLCAWPAIQDIDNTARDNRALHDHWAGWMATKRINLNVRQMWG